MARSAGSSAAADRRYYQKRQLEMQQPCRCCGKPVGVYAVGFLCGVCYNRIVHHNAHKHDTEIPFRARLIPIYEERARLGLPLFG
jgi:hypothetical protein